MIHAGISAIQILYEIFVRTLFGGFKDLCGYMLMRVSWTIVHG